MIVPEFPLYDREAPASQCTVFLRLSDLSAANPEDILDIENAWEKLRGSAIFSNLVCLIAGEPDALVMYVYNRDKYPTTDHYVQAFGRPELYVASGEFVPPQAVIDYSSSRETIVTRTSITIQQQVVGVRSARFIPDVPLDETMTIALKRVRNLVVEARGPKSTTLVQPAV